MQMNSQCTCPQCGVTLTGKAPRGLCPGCLIQLGRQLDLSETLSSDESRIDNHSIQIDANRTFGNYELLEEIARGGMGIVYRARQINLSRVVAVKMLLAGALAGKDFIQRFRTEAAAAASLQHANIVAIHEVGFLEGQHFFAMDYVNGVTLAQLAVQGPLPARKAATYLHTIAEAIHFAHERNVLHRDLKPSNILIDSATDQPRVTDFGLAKRLEAETELTLSGQVLGTPNFMSPEQATAKRAAVGKQSDVYSLGAILYYALTSRPPFQGETLTDVLLQVANNDPLAPHLLTPGLPHDLETICLKCLEKEPSARYQTAQDLADELSRFLRDEPIEARPISPLEKAWRWRQRKPVLASSFFLIVILLLILIIGSPLVVYRINQARKAETKQRLLAEENRERADQNLYDSDMSLAQHAWDEGDLGRTVSLLEAHRPQVGEKDRKDRRSFEWFYFRNLCEGDPHLTLRGHTQAVNCVAVSPDGKVLATGSAGDEVRIWDNATGNLIRTLPELNVVSLAYTPDGKMLGVGGRDQVAVWNLETWRIIFKQTNNFARFRIAFLSDGTRAVIGKRGGPFGKDGGSSELWDYSTGELKHAFPESGGHVAVSQRGEYLATGYTDKSVKIWDPATGRLVRSIKTGEAEAMALSPDGRILVTSHWGPEVELWNASTGRRIGSLTNNPCRVWSLAFSLDGKFLVTGGADQLIRIWDVASLHQVDHLKGHGNEVTSVALSTDGQTLVSGSKDRSAMLWRIPSDLHPRRPMTVISNVGPHPVFSPDGCWVAAGDRQGNVAAWDVASLKSKVSLVDASDAVAFSPDSSVLLTRGSNYFLKKFEVATGSVRETIPGRPAGEAAFHTVLSPDGRILAFGLPDGTLAFSDARTGVVKGTTAHAFSDQLFQLAFSPNGKLLAVASGESEAELTASIVKIWDTESYKIVTNLVGHTEIILSVAFSPNGKILATSSADNTIKFWDTTMWKESLPSLGQKEYVMSLAFSPDSKVLATVSNDRLLKLWNAATRHELASFKLDDVAMHLVFSPDGQTMAVLSWDHSLRLWRAPRADKEEPLPNGG
jgi:WD40 repeat protein/serine/threonine protein kinase